MPPHVSNTTLCVQSTSPISSCSSTFNGAARQVMRVGVPMTLVVMAMTAICLVILLKWKMRDRQHHRPVSQLTTTQPTETQADDTQGHQGAGVIVRVMLSGRAESACRLDLATYTDPPPSYEVAVIYDARPLQLVSDYQGSCFVVYDESVTCHPPAYQDVISTYRCPSYYDLHV